MPQKGPKPSDIAVEAKRYYIPRIEEDFPDVPARSYAYSEVASLGQVSKRDQNQRLRIAVLNADAVDVALQWNYEDSRQKAQDLTYAISSNELRIPLILGVDEKRAGGDWESSCMGAEENLCRRSNMVRCLARVRASPSDLPIYPIPAKGGIYSPQVVIFRSGASEAYKSWDSRRWSWLPIISIAPGRRPKLKSTTTSNNFKINEEIEPVSGVGGEDYTFAAERELMRDKIRTALRLSAIWGHRDIVVGPFGSGQGFYNPPRQLSAMWKQVLFEEEEFSGIFDNVVFAIENVTTATVPASPLSSSSIESSNSGVSTAASTSTTNTASTNSTAYSTNSGPKTSNTGFEAPVLSDYEIFKEEFEPRRLCKISYCKNVNGKTV